MTQRNDGGPAFPHIEPRDPAFSVCAPGMTLRDWFAGQALAGAMSSATHIDQVSDDDLRAAMKQVWRVADAMIAAREAE